jgi:hypothetical protein
MQQAEKWKLNFQLDVDSLEDRCAPQQRHRWARGQLRPLIPVCLRDSRQLLEQVARFEREQFSLTVRRSRGTPCGTPAPSSICSCDSVCCRAPGENPWPL